MKSHGDIAVFKWPRQSEDEVAGGWVSGEEIHRRDKESNWLFILLFFFFTSKTTKAENGGKKK